MQLLTVDGQLLFHQVLDQQQYFNERLLLRSFPKGIYTLVLSNQKGEKTTRRIVKQ